MNDIKRSNYFLEYNEKLIPIILDRIYPNLSKTIQKQTTPYNPPALTVVAFLNLDQKYKKEFDSILAEIEDMKYKICRTRQLHCTLLGLLSDKSPVLNPFFEELIKEKIIDFFNQWKSKGNQINFSLNFKRIRPGSWYGIENEPIPLASDGTIVAIGELNNKENNRFHTLGKSLAKYLRSKLPSIFSNEPDRKYQTIWCTFGYFDTPDFLMYERFVQTFGKWKSMSGIIPSINITKLQLVRTRFRSLEYSDIIHEFK
jgi:hypothetical protein